MPGVMVAVSRCDTPWSPSMLTTSVPSARGAQREGDVGVGGDGGKEVGGEHQLALEARLDARRMLRGHRAAVGVGPKAGFHGVLHQQAHFHHLAGRWRAGVAGRARQSDRPGAAAPTASPLGGWRRREATSLGVVTSSAFEAGGQRHRHRHAVLPDAAVVHHGHRDDVLRAGHAHARAHLRAPAGRAESWNTATSGCGFSSVKRAMRRTCCSAVIGLCHAHAHRHGVAVFDHRVHGQRHATRSAPGLAGREACDGGLQRRRGLGLCRPGLQQHGERAGRAGARTLRRVVLISASSGKPRRLPPAAR